MIAGNPKVGRSVTTFAIAILIAMILMTALVASRKRRVPAKEPPLHPPVLILMK
jgi:hypothetical protein